MYSTTPALLYKQTFVHVFLFIPSANRSILLHCDSVESPLPPPRLAAFFALPQNKTNLHAISTPLLVEAGEEEEDSDSSAIGSPLTGGNRTARGDDQGRLSGDRRQQQPSSSRGAAAANSSAAATSAWAIPPAPRPLGGIGGASFSRLQRGDYRSEGEQPSTERNGSRRRQRPLGEAARQDSFRTNRMPKRGGRKRLRRNLDRPAAARRRRIKIRVSSYCVARGLETLELLKWLESQPNRQLSIGYLAEGAGGAAAAPRGPVGAAAVAAAAATGAKTGGQEWRGGGDEAADSGGGGTGVDVETAGGPTATAAASPGVDGLEWMDSLYIDVIHSTTDLRGGLRKARELERPAWEADGYADGEDGDGDGYDQEQEGVDGTVVGGDGGEDEGDDAVTRHKDIMFFPYGAVVFWGCSEAEV